MSDSREEKIDIRKIKAEDCWPIRHLVMWPERELDFIKLDKDEEGFHFGLFVSHHLTSVISLFVEEDEAQFRKFATLNSEQGKGYGSKLLTFLIKTARTYPIKRIFCNARVERVSYYKKFGLERTNNVFERGGKNYVIMEMKI